MIRRALYVLLVAAIGIVDAIDGRLMTAAWAACVLFWAVRAWTAEDQLREIDAELKRIVGGES